MRGFRARGGNVEAKFEGTEAGVLRGLVAQLVELVRHDAPERTAQAEDPVAELIGEYGPTEPPTDAVLARLFPDAYPEDEEAAAEFRRFTERGLREHKVANAEVVLESLGDPAEAETVMVTLTPDQALSWLKSLTDVRLALGTRLGVTEDDEEKWRSLPDDDPDLHVYHLYLWLGWLQETLVEAIQ